MKNHFDSRPEFCFNLEIWSKIVMWSAIHFLDQSPFSAVSYTYVLRASMAENCVETAHELISRTKWRVFTGLPYGNPSLKMDGVCSVLLLFFFFCVGKSLACHSPGKWYLVHRAFWAYFLRIERVVELRRFLQWTQ